MSAASLARYFLCQPLHGGFQRLDNLFLLAVARLSASLALDFSRRCCSFSSLRGPFPRGSVPPPRRGRPWLLRWRPAAASGGSSLRRLALLSAGSRAAPVRPPPAWRGSCPPRSAGRQPGRCPRPWPAPVWPWRFQALARGDHGLFQFLQFVDRRWRRPAARLFWPWRVLSQPGWGLHRRRLLPPAWRALQRLFCGRRAWPLSLPPPLQAFLAGLEAHARVLGFFVFLTQLQNFGLGGAVVLHQRDIAGADPGAGAALDTVKQVVLLPVFRIPCPGQTRTSAAATGCRAGLGAHAAAYAGLGRWRRGQFRLGGGQQAVGGFDDGTSAVGTVKPIIGPPMIRRLFFPPGIPPVPAGSSWGCRSVPRSSAAAPRLAGNRGNPGYQWPALTTAS